MKGEKEEQEEVEVRFNLQGQQKEGLHSTLPIPVLSTAYVTIYVSKSKRLFHRDKITNGEFKKRFTYIFFFDDMMSEPMLLYIVIDFVCG